MSITGLITDSIKFTGVPIYTPGLWKQGAKLTFSSSSHLAPKYYQGVANSKTLVAIMTHTHTVFTLSLY